MLNLPRRTVQKMPRAEDCDPPVGIESEQMLIPCDNQRSLCLDSAFEHTVVIRVRTIRDCAWGIDGAGQRPQVAGSSGYSFLAPAKLISQHTLHFVLDGLG